MINVIAVDDEKDVKVLFDHFFKAEVDAGDVNLIFVDNAAACLESITKLSGSTVVVSDINMPEMNGIELLKQINKNYKSLETVLVSAYDKEYYAEQLKDEKVAGFISKPVDFAALKNLIFSISSST